MRYQLTCEVRPENQSQRKNSSWTHFITAPLWRFHNISWKSAAALKSPGGPSVRQTWKGGAAAFLPWPVPCTRKEHLLKKWCYCTADTRDPQTPRTNAPPAQFFFVRTWQVWDWRRGIAWWIFPFRNLNKMSEPCAKGLMTVLYNTDAKLDVLEHLSRGTSLRPHFGQTMMSVWHWFLQWLAAIQAFFLCWQQSFVDLTADFAPHVRRSLVKSISSGHVSSKQWKSRVTRAWWIVKEKRETAESVQSIIYDYVEDKTHLAGGRVCLQAPRHDGKLHACNNSCWAFCPILCRAVRGPAVTASIYINALWTHLCVSQRKDSSPKCCGGMAVCILPSATQVRILHSLLLRADPSTICCGNTVWIVVKQAIWVSRREPGEQVESTRVFACWTQGCLHVGWMNTTDFFFFMMLKLQQKRTNNWTVLQTQQFSSPQWVSQNMEEQECILGRHDGKVFKRLWTLSLP